jgi:hypothetical protein
MAITVAEQTGRTTKIGLYLKRDHTRQFVAVTTADEGSYAVSTAAGIPSIGAAHPEDPVALCVDVDSKPHAGERDKWIVNLKYTNDLPEEDIDDDDPTSARPKSSWGADDFSRFVSEDRDGAAIVNKAGDRYEDPIEIIDTFPTLTITKNLNSFNVSTVFAYNNSTNSDTFKGAAPGTLRVKITASEEWRGDAAYWATSYVFRYNPNGWQPSILEQGLYQKIPSIYGPTIFSKVPCTEKGKGASDSDKVTVPVPLDANGVQIDPDTLHDIPCPAQFTTWNVLPELPYAALGV